MIAGKVSRRQKHPAFVFESFQWIDGRWVGLPAGDASRRVQAQDREGRLQRYLVVQDSPSLAQPSKRGIEA
jgi:hypothetical protein